jgi:hypothetical protein
MRSVADAFSRRQIWCAKCKFLYLLPILGSHVISIKRIAVDAVLVVMLFIVVGELSFRIPGATQKLAYAHDPELRYLYKPDHTGVMFLGNYSVQSPPITINDRGFRGESIDPLRPSILVCGSSEVIAPGVEDGQTFSAKLERKLKVAGYDHQVINLGIGGHGPYHHKTIARRFVSELAPTHVIVRVSSGDRNFHRPTVEELEKSRQLRIRNDKISRVTLFFPFLHNKLRAQVDVIGSVFRELWAKVSGGPNVDRNVYGISEETGIAMWNANSDYWMQLVSDSRNEQFKLIFVIPNAQSLDADKLIAARLTSMAGSYENVSILELDAHDYSAPDIDGKQLAEWYSQTYTLGYDPHSNVRHQEFIADRLFRVLEEQLEPNPTQLN